MAKFIVLQDPITDKRERVKQGFNFPAFFFGPIYYLTKGRILLAILWLVITVIFPHVVILTWILSGASANKFRKMYLLRRGWMIVSEVDGGPTKRPHKVSRNYYNEYPGAGILNSQKIYNLDRMMERFVVLDVETTGLNPLSDRIIEISINKYENGELIDQFHSLVNPEMPIPRIATGINGISDAMVKKKPKIYEIIREIECFLKDEIVVGYNVEFDLKFISNAFARSSLSIEQLTYFDVLDLVKETIRYGMTKNYKLKTIKEYFNISTDSHRAVSDCVTTFEVMKRCIEIKQEELNKQEIIQQQRILNMNDFEKEFISALEKKLEEIGLRDKLTFNVMGDKVINFKIDQMQIGRVKLRGKFKMQIIDKNNVMWLDIDGVEEAIMNLKHWMKYCKYLLRD
ncbi:ribonuclease H-like domain-containing protein [Neobacillus cucumis]|uniref:exonuclease domain-containing protein n=1 Tax=Neobacillus cucumis TaxID=1740721 RepID=UPI0018DEFE2B|nr:exonuclease domain-containing protein [Neobacillus cucumis]MBI0579819.1 ribonuclease H-like domain-containing protein [Neobacillus cucumis]